MPTYQISDKYSHATYKCYAVTGQNPDNLNRFNNYRGHGYNKNSRSNDSSDTKKLTASIDHERFDRASDAPHVNNKHAPQPHSGSAAQTDSVSALSINDISISWLRNYDPVIGNGIGVFVLVDTGADICEASKIIFDSIIKDNYVDLKLDRQTVMTADKNVIPILKRVRIRVCIGNIVVHTDFYIIKN